MNKIVATFLLLSFLMSPVYAASFDTSIDDNIRKSYNVEPSNCDDDILPKLPSTVPTMYEEPEIKAQPTGKTYTLKSGTKIKLILQKNISDKMVKGSKIPFTCENGFVTKEGAIVPAGTKFRGTITDSHTPQLTGNGGLIEIQIDEIYFNGVQSKIETKLSKANDKKIFLGNIKGQRSYWKNFAKATKPGRTVFSATKTAASAMLIIPFVNILSVIPYTAGAIVYTANVAVAPVIAVFTKGKSISLPSGTEFEIKLTENCQIKG
jgi:hypothetical protein